jgi:hypothetical protein
VVIQKQQIIFLLALVNLSCGSSVTSTTPPCNANATLTFYRTYTRPFDVQNSSARLIRFKSKEAFPESQALTWNLRAGELSADFDSPTQAPADEIVDFSNSQVSVGGQNYFLQPVSSRNGIDTYTIRMKTRNFIHFKKSLQETKASDFQFCSPQDLSAAHLIVDNGSKTATFQFLLTLNIAYSGTDPHQSLRKLACGYIRPFLSKQDFESSACGEPSNESKIPG